MNVFSSLFIIAKMQNLNIHQLVREYTKYGLSIFAVAYHSGTKRNEVLMRATTQMNLENTVPSERSQSKGAYCHDFINVKFIE